MHVTVNGQEKSLDEGATVSDMLTTLKLDLTGMIIERNLEVVPRSEYEKTKLSDGDNIELIRLVAGG